MHHSLPTPKRQPPPTQPQASPLRTLLRRRRRPCRSRRTPRPFYRRGRGPPPRLEVRHPSVPPPRRPPPSAQLRASRLRNLRRRRRPPWPKQCLKLLRQRLWRSRRLKLLLRRPARRRRARLPPSLPQTHRPPSAPAFALEGFAAARGAWRGAAPRAREKRRRRGTGARSDATGERRRRRGDLRRCLPRTAANVARTPAAASTRAAPTRAAVESRTPAAAAKTADWALEWQTPAGCALATPAGLAKCRVKCAARRTKAPSPQNAWRDSPRSAPRRAVVRRAGNGASPTAAAETATAATTKQRRGAA
mmetsp:Transcript_16272/g.56858  ORF Transcript_16272/g.56858 Transcript_16272/m.56858 type:complete len:306 (+) Transcript_16272:171-1088(+)